jgi:glycosyltransferase involved in cell wall biosynthesis
MKVLHILYSGLGGHGNVFFSMIEADRNKVFEYEALFNGVEGVRQEYIQRCTDKQIKWYYVFKKPGLDVGYYVGIYKKIRLSKPDILMLHGSGLILPSWLAKIFSRNKIKIIVRETQANHLKTKIEWFWLVFALLLANKVIFLSKEYKEEIGEKLSLISPERKQVVIPNGVDMDRFSQGKPGREDKVIIGMQSRLVKIKDHMTLIAAMARLKEADPHIRYKLKIAGDGEYMGELKSHARKLQVEDIVEFSGMLNEEELVLFIQSLNIYVHASFGETMSTAIMQAMCCKVPIIASDVKGINNMIRHNYTGILVPVNNVNELALQIAHLCADKDLQEVLKTNAYKYAQLNFSNKQMFEEYKHLFTSIGGKNKKDAQS